VKEYRLLRFTPRRTLTYNNRWCRHVLPKHTLFFIPVEEEQVMAWLNFLCTKHHKTALYIHTIVLRARTVSTRVLTVWKGVPLVEVMIRDRDYHKRMKHGTQRVLKGAVKPPTIVRKFLQEIRLHR